VLPSSPTASASASVANGWAFEAQIVSPSTTLGTPLTARWATPGISTDRWLPSLTYVIGTERTPSTSLISGDSSPSGPPADPLKIACSASCWSPSARSSR